MPSTVAHTCNHNTQEAGAEGSRIQGHLGLPNEFIASLEYTRPSQQQKDRKFKISSTHLKDETYLTHGISSIIGTRP